MVTLNPCSRLGTVFNQLVPTILVEVKAEKIQSVIDDYLPNLEDRCYRLADECEALQCKKECHFCETEFIREFFLDTRAKLVTLKRERNTFHHQHPIPVLV